MTVRDTEIQESAGPIIRTPQTTQDTGAQRSKGADVIWDLQRQVCGQATELTPVYTPQEKTTASPPYMHVTIEDVLVRCGEMAKFHAIIEGNPQPLVAWFKGITLLTDSERVHQFNEGNRSSLILYNASLEDGGVYTCMAKNTSGEVLCKAELVVQEDKKSQEGKKQSTRRKLHSFYEVKQEIGRGSFSFVKRVIHKESRLPCAAKFIPLRSKTRDRAYQERDILATLYHGRITQLLDQFETRKTLILILELCTNEELLDRLFRKNRVTEAEVKLYMKQLLEGIGYLHDNKILHLDIKPPNILMAYDDKDDLKICDFGFAQRINPAEPQYSKYGSPEFVSPEILSQSPVSTASDIWPVGVITFLSLTCKSPFAGENDRATLLNIQNGTISWDIPDFTHLSKEAKDFIANILQLSPKARPNAAECLSHGWFEHNLQLEEVHFIDTKQLKFFVSRSKWQRSLMCYKSVLVMRPIPEVLERAQKSTSLGVSRNLVEESSSSSTSGSSSDNEIAISPAKRHLPYTPELHLSVLEGSNYHECFQHPAEGQRSESSLRPVKPRRHKPGLVKGKLSAQPDQEREELMIDAEGIHLERKIAEDGAERSLRPMLGAAEVFDSASPHPRAGLLLPEEGKIEKAEAGRSPGCVPRHSVIKSTFYSQPAASLMDVPASPGKEHRKHLERAKRTYRKAGYSKAALSGLRDPLLEQFELGEEGGASGDEEMGLFHEADLGPLTKSASFDTAQRSPRVPFPVSSRSRSLDDYRMRKTSFAEEQSIEEEDELLSQGSPAEVAHRRHDKPSTKEDSQKTQAGYSEEKPVLLAQGGGRHVLMTQQQDAAWIPPPPMEKKGDVHPKTKLPLSTKAGASALGDEGMILDVQQSASGLAPKHKTEEATLYQTSTSLDHMSLGSVLPQGDSSILSVSQKPSAIQGTLKSAGQFPQVPCAQSEVKPVVMAKGKSPAGVKGIPVSEGYSLLPPRTSAFTDIKSAAREGKHLSAPVSQSEQKDQKILPPAPKSAAPEGKDSASLTVSQSKTTLTSTSEAEGQKPVHQKSVMPSETKLPFVTGESPACTELRPVALLEGGGQRIIPQQKPSAYSNVFSSVLISASPTKQPTSQVETTPVSESYGESHPALSPQSSMYEVAMAALSEAKSHQTAKPTQPLIDQGEHHEHPHEKSFVPTQKKPAASEGQTRQPCVPVTKAGPSLISAGESQKYGHEQHLLHSEPLSVVPKGKRPDSLVTLPTKTGPFSALEAEYQDYLYCMPPSPTTGKYTVRRGLPATSQARTSPFSVYGGENLIALKKTPLSADNGKSREHMQWKPSVYSATEAATLDHLVDEMVCLSKEMTALAESVSDTEGARRHMSPPRYLVRRGKREGGIGLADPSEAGVIYPGEEDCFNMPPSMIKRARMASPYEADKDPRFASSEFGDRFGYYSAHQGMYDVDLVQIRDLWEDMPRPDSKTAKYDISEVEPAFLNLSELYDIAYYPFEFLSFRKAPEKLPSKRLLGEKAKFSPGLKIRSHQDKKMCLRDYNLQGGATRVTSKDGDAEPELTRELEHAPTPRMGRRSDSDGDIPVGSQPTYALPTDSTGKRRSSLQSRLGAFKPFVRSRSMELIEQGLKKKMKASVAHLSRMLTRKPSPDQGSRESSEERKSDQQERASLTETSGTVKKKTGFPSFVLPSFRTKEKAPSFVEELTDQTIALGQSVTLSCRTSTHSSPRIEWFKDGAAIRSTDRILISSTLKHYQLLTILAATTGDFGSYACVATNSLGTVSTSCVIRKAEAPSNPPSPDIVEILEDGVRLAWKPVELNTPVTYTVLCKKEDGEWKTLASDISNCCYVVENLPWGLVCSFRIACVSKASVGPYSNPTAKVTIGEKDQAEFQASRTEDSTMSAPAQPTHQTYAFQTEIKRGRFSIIKQCREKLSGNPLAAKIIPYRQEDKDPVLQEYHILRKLHHTNIGQLQGAYVSPRHLVLILELCVGPELLHALAGRSSYSEVEVRDYLWQILSAVEYLHAQNILHLDLRSENMIITEPNLLKLLDFGNAQFYVPDRVITLDRCTDYVETMASELLSNKGAAPQTDIWAIGITAFIMLSAEYPINPEAACDFGRLIKRDKIKVNRCYAGLSGGAVSFLQSALSSNPWRRPTASECLQSPWLQETGLDAKQQATVTFSTAKLRNFVAERERKRALLCSKYGLMTI